MRLVILLLFMATSVFSQTQPPIETGVSQSLAQWRAKHYSDIRYKLNLTIEKMSPLMKGEVEIRVTLDDEATKNPLILDWRTTAYQNDKDKPFADIVGVNDALDIRSQVNNEHLLIPNGLLKVGENTIKIQFASPIKTSGSAITRYIDKEDGSEYIYSLFVPSDASTAFPVFDQPDLKAKFTLKITVPLNWTSISNSSAKVYSTKNRSDTTYSTEFEETQPISTYVFAFAAGNFEEFSDTPFPRIGSGSKTAYYYSRPSDMLIYVRKSQAEKFKQHSAEVFRLNRECVKYLEEYFDYKFPFPKYDLVLIPEFPFGGMEHAGATFLRESSIIFPSEPTKNDLISRANVIFHEAAHQWFGDTVTMKWFDDLWLKEGFAEFMAYKTLEKIMPEMNAWKAFYERNKQLAYLTDSTKGTTPIYQEIPNLSSAKSAYGNIVYRKAPSFLRQAEFYLGEKEFQTAVRNFLKKNEFKNATWQDLVGEFENATKKYLKEWSETWIQQRGLGKMNIVSEPVFAQQMTQETPAYYYSLRQENLLDFRKGKAWEQKMSFFIIGENKQKMLFNFTFGGINVGGKTDGGLYKTIDVFDDSPLSLSQRPLKFLSDKDKPIFIFPNYQDYGYGIFLLDEKSRNYILANVQNEKDDFLRSMMYGSLWDSVREAELNPKDFVELAIKNVGTEKDEMIVSAILSRVNTAFAYYLDDKTRNELSPKLEEVLINKMQTAETLGQKITFYRAFLNVVSSEKGKDLLKDFLKPKAQNQSPFALKTKDKFDIVAKLLILGDKDAKNLLDELTKTETSDDAKRYAYAALAGIPTAENKAKYWQDFVGNKEISESWIESALGNFNSTKHSDLTIQYLEKALAELPNLKRNRKIFFVNGWLSAFIGGQKSEQALAIVNKFLADNPNLDKDLKLKILENVDIIERAVKIRQKFAN